MTGAANVIPRSPPLASMQAALNFLGQNGVRGSMNLLLSLFVVSNFTRFFSFWSVDDVTPSALLAGNDTRLALRIALVRFVDVCN